MKYHAFPAILGLLLAGILLPEASAEVPPLAAVSPLRIGVLQPQGLELQLEGDPGWSCAFSTAYGNSFSFSPEVLEAHRIIDGRGRPMSPEAFEFAVRNFPGADLYAVDAEVLRIDLEVSFQALSGFFAGGRLSSFELGGTGLDSWPESLHSFLGIDDNGREAFPRGETFIGTAPAGESWMVSDEESLRPVSIEIWGGRRWELGKQAWHRAWISFGIPLSEMHGFGARKPSIGIRWMAGRSFSALSVYGGLGFSLGGGDAGTLGNAENCFHYWAGLSLPLGKDVDAELMARIDDSPFERVDPGKAGRSTGEFAVGLSFPLSQPLRLALALGEDFPGMGLPPDFSLQCRLLWRFSR